MSRHLEMNGNVAILMQMAIKHKTLEQVLIKDCFNYYYIVRASLKDWGVEFSSSGGYTDLQNIAEFCILSITVDTQK